MDAVETAFADAIAASRKVGFGCFWLGFGSCERVRIRSLETRESIYEESGSSRRFVRFENH